VRELKDTVVAITGASSGIGEATARALVAADANVVRGARREDRLQGLVDELGDRVRAVRCDVRSIEDSRALVDAALTHFGRLDTLVANAGIGAYGGILDVSDEDLRDIMDTNLPGTVWPIRAAVPHMLEQAGGDIVIISSVAGLRGGANEAVYAATKFAQVGLAGALDRELREHGIRVTALCPAGVKTEFAIGAGRTEGDPALDEYLQPEDLAHAVRVVLEQPRRLRTTQWTIWPMSQSS
jgi:NADP-dependent 3-hydroxy acid dehydrogenase YdfG